MHLCLWNPACSFHCPSSRQLTLSADSLRTLRVDVFIGLRKFFCQSPFTALSLMPFAKLKSDLIRLFLRHKQLRRKGREVKDLSFFVTLRRIARLGGTASPHCAVSMHRERLVRLVLAVPIHLILLGSSKHL